VHHLQEESMTTVTPLHAHFRPAHLEHVIAEMRRRGPPRIRAHFDTSSGAWLALEGTHRLRAAKLLDLAPVMLPVRWPRSALALMRARFAAVERGHIFDRVTIGAPA
jgi:hypothetical protein